MRQKTRDADDHSDLCETFKKFDRDGNKLFATSQLRNLMSSYGLKMEEAEIDEMILEFEYDQDGYIQYEEFVTKMMQ